MSYKISGNTVTDSSNKTVAKIYNLEIKDASNNTIAKIQPTGKTAQVVDSHNQTIAKIQPNGDILDGSNQKVTDIKTAKKSFPHPNDHVAASLYVLLAA